LRLNFTDIDPREGEVATPVSEGEEPLEGTGWFTQEETIDHGSEVANETQPNTTNVMSNKGNFPDYTITDADRKLDEVYGNHIYQKLGEYLDGGVANDLMWEDYWECLVVYPSKTFTIPTGAVGRWFIKEMPQQPEDIIKQKCNSEKFIVLYQMVILQRVSGINCFSDIKRTIEQ
jgi:hypothetical protein